MVIFKERHDGDAKRFEEALRTARHKLKEANDIFEDMKEQFSDRNSYGDVYSDKGYGGFSNRDEAGQMDSHGSGMSNRDWDEYKQFREFQKFQQRSRNSMGQYQ